MYKKTTIFLDRFQWVVAVGQNLLSLWAEDGTKKGTENGIETRNDTEGKGLGIGRETGIGKGDVIPWKDDVCRVQGADPDR